MKNKINDAILASMRRNLGRMVVQTVSTMSYGGRRMRKRGGVEMNLTEAEAVSVLQNHINTYYEQMSESELNSYQMAINSMKKQIPMKPIKSKEERYGMGYEYHDWVCPSCGRFLAPEPAQTGNHHCKCGQAIDWKG